MLLLPSSFLPPLDESYGSPVVRGKVHCGVVNTESFDSRDSFPEPWSSSSSSSESSLHRRRQQLLTHSTLPNCSTTNSSLVLIVETFPVILVFAGIHSTTFSFPGKNIDTREQTHNQGNVRTTIMSQSRARNTRTVMCCRRANSLISKRSSFKALTGHRVYAERNLL